jgi:hypothetical protein
MSPIKIFCGFVAALLLSVSCQAANWDLVVNGKAFHIGAEHNWNEDNWGLGFEREFASHRRWVPFAVGNGFRDSMNHMSYMGGGGIKRRFRPGGWMRDLYLDVGLVGFLMRRQNIRNGNPFPGLLPIISIGNRRVALNLTYLPDSAVDSLTRNRRADPNMDGVLFLQAKFSLDYVLPNGR